MRNLSSDAIESANARETDEVWLDLLTIEHDLLPEPLRFVNDTVNMVSRGDLYIGYPMDLPMRDEIPEELRDIRLTLSNVDASIIEAMRSVTGRRPKVTVETVLASDPDTVEIGPIAMVAKGADYNEDIVTITLGPPEYMTQTVPSLTMTPATTPGLFR